MKSFKVLKDIFVDFAYFGDFPTKENLNPQFEKFINFIIKHNISIETILNGYLFGNETIQTDIPGAKNVKIDQNLKKFIVFLTLLFLNNYSISKGYDSVLRNVILFTKTRHTNLFAELVQGTDLEPMANGYLTIRNIFVDKIVKNRRLFPYMSLLQYERSVSKNNLFRKQDIELILSFFSFEERQSLKGYKGYKGYTSSLYYFKDSHIMAHELEGCHNKTYEFDFLRNMAESPDKECFLIQELCDASESINNRDKISFLIEALAIGYFGITPQLDYICDMYYKHMNPQYSGVLGEFVNKFRLKRFENKLPVDKLVRETITETIFLQNLIEARSLNDFFDILIEDTSRIKGKSRDQVISYNKERIIMHFNRLCRKLLSEDKYGEDRILILFEDLCDHKELWDIIIELLKSSEHFPSRYKEGVLNILEERGSLNARMVLIEGYITGKYGINVSKEKFEDKVVEKG